MRIAFLTLVAAVGLGGPAFAQVGAPPPPTAGGPATASPGAMPSQTPLTSAGTPRDTTQLPAHRETRRPAPKQ